MAAWLAKGSSAPLGDTGQVKAAEREAAIRRQRELALAAMKARRRAKVLGIARTIGFGIGLSAGFPLARALARHEPFDVATMGLAAAGYAVAAALVWGGYLTWERWRG